MTNYNRPKLPQAKLVHRLPIMHSLASPLGPFARGNLGDDYSAYTESSCSESGLSTSAIALGFPKKEFCLEGGFLPLVADSFSPR